MEMKKFAKMFYKGVKVELTVLADVQNNTFFQSSGVADLITTCWGGRNVRCAEAFVRTGKVCLVKENKEQSWEQLEAEMLNGQKLQGTTTCKEVYDMLINSQVMI